MLIKNLYSLLFLPFLVLIFTRNKIASFLIVILLLTIYSPDRRTGRCYERRVVHCPSSGKIMNITINKQLNIVRIAIFLNVYNNHTQYVPINSRVVETKRIHGPNFPAYTIKSSHNEQHVTLLYNEENDMHYKVYQMTGIIARRLKSLVKINHSYLAGDRLGFIFLGSRVDIELPLNKVKSVLVKNNQKVSAMQPLLIIH